MEVFMSRQLRNENATVTPNAAAIAFRQNGSSPDHASETAGRYIADVTHVAVPPAYRR
jgi:hypothetical protein